ncbi:MAG: ABC transporter ATP-binding protein [Chthonomonadaceae bacterium]|nr:ABC transporter ATP-binding protein [Chthonomonadaceae bacterium]
MSQPLLSVRNVTKRYPETADSPEVEVLRGVDLSLEAQETAAIVGRSGSGKSTLLNLIGTLDTPTSGEIEINGRVISSLKPKELSALRNQEIGMVFQLHHLLPQCTALENVLIPTLAPPGKTRKLDESPEARAKRLLSRVGLGDRLTHLTGQLSGGERQRVALVRALIHAPSLLLADEPTGALDVASSETLLALLSELNTEENVAILMITHSSEAASRMGRILRMEDGKLSS